MFSHFFARKVSAFAATVAFVLWGLLGVATPVAAQVQAQVQTAVEYGVRGFLDYGYSAYFVTSSPDEIAALDGGAFNTTSGSVFWERTTLTFNVWSGPGNGALPACRFFSADSTDHFYTPYVSECDALRANADWHWQYEGIAFYLQVPDDNGNCPIGTTILYRLYGQQGGTHHRLTTHAATFHAMLAEGWVFEGDGRTFAFACVPLS